MLDHVGFAVSDFGRSRAFYTEALAPLAITLIMEVTPEQSGGEAHAGFGADGKPFFWIGTGKTPGGAAHVALTAESRATVDATCGGVEGWRPGQWRARTQAALSSRLLRGIRP